MSKDIEKQFFNKLVDILEESFEKGEKCSCGKKLTARSHALVLNAWANIFLKQALVSQEEELKAQWRKEIESCLHKDKDCWVGEEPGCGVNQTLSDILKKL